MPYTVLICKNVPGINYSLDTWEVFPEEASVTKTLNERQGLAPYGRVLDIFIPLTTPLKTIDCKIIYCMVWIVLVQRKRRYEGY